MTASITFFIQVYGERKRLIDRYAEIRKWYPNARIVIRFDGDDKPKDSLAELSLDSQVELYEEERLFTVEHGGTVCHRMLELFFLSATDFLIKVDSDTHIKKTLAQLPNPEDLYYGGFVQQRGKLPSIQGGCIILSRALCQQLLDSRILTSPDFKPPKLVWAADAVLRDRALIMGLSSHDWCLGYAAQQLAVVPSWHPEVLSRPWCLRLTDAFKMRKAAFIHPCTDSKLGVFGLENMRGFYKYLRYKCGWQERKFQSQQSLKTQDFSLSEDMHPTIVRWLATHIQSGQKILQLHCDKSSRELARFFPVTAVSEASAARQYDGVNYLYYSRNQKPEKTEILNEAVNRAAFDVLVVDAADTKQLAHADEIVKTQSFIKCQLIVFINVALVNLPVVVKLTRHQPQLRICLFFAPFSSRTFGGMVPKFGEVIDKMRTMVAKI